MQDKSSHSISVFSDGSANDDAIYNMNVPPTLPLLVLRNMVIFPGILMPVGIGRQRSLDVVKRAYNSDTLIVTATQTNPSIEEPGEGDIHPYGTVAKVVNMMELPDGTTTAIIQAFAPVIINELIDRGSHYEAFVIKRNERTEETEDSTYTALMQTLNERVAELSGLVEMPAETIFSLKQMADTPVFLNFVCTHMPVPIKDKIQMLATESPLERGTLILRALAHEIHFAQIRRDLRSKTQADIDQQQREYFLQQEIRNIQNQLGNHPDAEIEELRKKAKKMKWGEEMDKTFERELTKLERIQPQNPDYNVQMNYLQTLLQLPWNVLTTDNLDLRNAERTLNRNHYGMKEVKERILEHLAVRHMRGPEMKPTILCLYGPPGVGKTSLCRSIADALKRKYVRASLGGMHDEAEIRGHRRTYIGAMPGRIIKNLIKAGSANPVFVLDEIDKVTENTIHGDPASALLEVLDPEQNETFHDNFLDVDFDLSKVMFIATANNVGAIPRPLLDRMELIEVSGYITEEKIEIAKRHLIPRVKEACGIADHKEIRFSKDGLEFLIENYTRESGVRGLEKELNRFFRKVVLRYELDQVFPCTTIKREDIVKLLGKVKYQRDIYQGNGYAGVVTGLAWTSVGGEILFIETSLSKGKGQKLTLTGNLGDVMKESAMLALEFIKAHAEDLNIDIRIFDNYNIHLHVPEGAVPKDGPSAGITMATSLASALTQRRVRKNLAMTGEITLRGKVLPVGGIKEKILAAKRAGITDIILCDDNRKDIEEIDELYLRGLNFRYVRNVMDVLDIALLPEKVDHPIEFKFEEQTLPPAPPL